MVWSELSEVRYTLKTWELGHILNLLMEEKTEKLKHVGEACSKRLSFHLSLFEKVLIVLHANEEI